MKKTVCHFLLILSFVGNAVTVFSQNSHPKKCIYHVGRAYSYIISEKNDSALYYFDRAFKKKKHPFAEDLYNSVVLADMEKEKRLYKKWRKKLSTYLPSEEVLHIDTTGNFRMRVKPKKSHINLAYRKLIDSLYTCLLYTSPSPRD